MGLGINDIFSCLCGSSSEECHDHKGDKNNNIFLWVLIAVVFFCFCGKGSFLGNNCNPCDPCAPKQNNNSSLVIVIAIVLLCICSNDGIGGLGGLGGGPSGNLNTNIINLDREDYCDDYC
jgi:hypothetical protein